MAKVIQKSDTTNSRYDAERGWMIYEDLPARATS
jgi:hypothetical protein